MFVSKYETEKEFIEHIHKVSINQKKTCFFVFCFVFASFNDAETITLHNFQ